jgi:hypothetical protein
MPSHRRHSHKTDKQKGIFTIPELRVAFENIEDMVASMIRQKKSDAEITSALTAEWMKVFYRKLDKNSAKSYVDYVREEVKMGRSPHKTGSGSGSGSGTSKRRGTRKNQKGGGGQDATSSSMPLQGAPLDYDTRPGIYPPAGDIPPKSFGPSTPYIDSGFNVAVPEQGYKHDLEILPPNRLYPTHPGESGKLGLSGGGSRRTRTRTSRLRLRKGTQKGGAPSWFPQALQGAPMARLTESSSPPSVQYTAFQTFNGLPPQNLSPDPSQNHLKYLMAPGGKSPDISVAEIPINLKSDIRVN